MVLSGIDSLAAVEGDESEGGQVKGTDLTQAQIDAAERFILARRAKANTHQPAEDEHIVQKWGDVVRLVAWYGAIRYKAGSEGLSSLENPGDPT